MGKELTAQELHNLAMNIVGKHMKANGFEFLAVNSTLKKNPQFVGLRDKKLHFVIVRAVVYPNDPKVYDEDVLFKIKEHALKFEARAFYAGVGITNVKDSGLPIFLNEDYALNYEGLVEI